MSDAANDVASQLTEILKTTNKSSLEAVDFLRQQAPELCDQFLRMELIGAIYGIIVAVIIFLVGYFLFRKIKKIDEDPAIPLAYVLFVITTLVSSITFLCNFINFLNVLIAPKVVLFEFIMRSLHGK